MASHRVITLGPGEVDRVEPLWKVMVAHHREVAGDEWPVRSAEDAWETRRAQYVEWLSSGQGSMLAAVPCSDPDADPVGYAVVMTHPSGASWDVGERVGDLESLSVATDERGQGIGTLLIDSCRDLLREERIAYWGVSLVEANVDAMRLYERAGFRPFYRSLLTEI
jgi:GNAT superfamily N-acetyltransferase